MFRLWGKVMKSNHLLKDMVYCDSNDLNRTRKVYKGLEEMCQEFDLEHPMWLQTTIRDFQRQSKCRFTRDCFIEDIDFDYLEIQVIEED